MELEDLTAEEVIQVPVGSKETKDIEDPKDAWGSLVPRETRYLFNVMW